MAMTTPVAAELVAVEEALAANERDARTLIAGLTEAQGGWRPAPGSWSVAECLDHLATANRVYLAAMTPPAARALAEGRHRRRPARPGAIGRWFIGSLEPPSKPLSRRRAPRVISPRDRPPLADAVAAFLASQDDVRVFLRRYADIDLAGVRFPNPLVRGVRFSLATGLHVIAAHERRHLWQAWQVRREIEAAPRSPAAGPHDLVDRGGSSRRTNKPGPTSHRFISIRPATQNLRARPFHFRQYFAHPAGQGSDVTFRSSMPSDHW
jgi:DinB superfamily